MRSELLVAMTLGVLAAACQPAEQARYPSSAPPIQAYSPNYTNAAEVCRDYGFTPATADYDRCVSRERAARAAGRVDRDYAESRLTGDAETACLSYGLQPTSPHYQTCVSREVDARRYQGGDQVHPAYRVDPSGNRIDAEGNRVDIYGNRLPS